MFFPQSWLESQHKVRKRRLSSELGQHFVTCHNIFPLSSMFPLFFEGMCWNPSGVRFKRTAYFPSDSGNTVRLFALRKTYCDTRILLRFLFAGKLNDRLHLLYGIFRLKYSQKTWSDRLGLLNYALKASRSMNGRYSSPDWPISLECLTFVWIESPVNVDLKDSYEANLGSNWDAYI